jgi:hypothetical protein
MRKVFSTILNTVPDFFEQHKNSGIWVQGSDSENQERSFYAGLFMVLDFMLRLFL